MNKPYALKKGDRIAIVSLSSGILGEATCAHQLNLGIKRLQSLGLNPVFMETTLKGQEYVYHHPEARAADLKAAFSDDSIKGIICAIGGDETYRLLPYLMDDEAFIQSVYQHPKLFTGFSDTTNNHLMFYKLGMVSFYGPTFLSDLAELGEKMLPYTYEAFLQYFKEDAHYQLSSSPIWYEERQDFSSNALQIPRLSHLETRGIEVLYGEGIVRGRLLGGCLESLFDGYTGDRYVDQKEIYDRYELMPSRSEWVGKLLFIETSEDCPKPEDYQRYIDELIHQGVFDKINGIIVGKPQNEKYYDAYKSILKPIVSKYRIPTLYNLNFGHAYPRGIVPYGLEAEMDLTNKTLTVIESFFQSSR